MNRRTFKNRLSNEGSGLTVLRTGIEDEDDDDHEHEAVSSHPPI
jgi:hypothetical protein